MNLASTSVQVQLGTSVIPILPSDYLAIGLPAKLKSQMNPEEAYCRAPLECTLVDSYIKVANFSSTFFEIKGLTNPPSTRPSDPVTLKRFDEENRLVQICNETIQLRTQAASDTQEVRMI